jgi:hypothetical protein
VPIITVDNLKTHLGITDTVDDDTINVAVAAANQAVVQHCGRTFDKVAEGDESARVYFTCSGSFVEVDDFWSTTNLVIKTDEGDTGTYGTTWATTDYRLTPTNALRDGLPWPYNKVVALASRVFPVGGYHPRVQITAAWGWSSIPDAVFEATLIKAARLFRRKDSPDGLIGGFSDLGAVRVSSYEDPDVTALLSPFVGARGNTGILIA